MTTRVHPLPVSHLSSTVPHQRPHRVPRRIVLTSLILILKCLLIPTQVLANSCSFLPIVVRLDNVLWETPGTILPEMVAAGNPYPFAWLHWTGVTNISALITSLTLPGNSSTYTNPYNSSDHRIDPGDWILGRPDLPDIESLRTALDALRGRPIMVAVTDLPRVKYDSGTFRIFSFIAIELLDYHLDGPDRLTLRYLGPIPCGRANKPPYVSAGLDQSITLPNVANLYGRANDDLLPQGTFSICWTAVTSPGLVTFAHPSSLSTTVSFGAPGCYTLKLIASDGACTSMVTMTISVAPSQQQPPTAFPQSLTTLEDVPLNLLLTGQDPESDSLQFFVTAQPSHGTLNGTPPRLTYLPDPNYHGTDAFSFKVNDGQLDSSPAAISLTIQPANDPPHVHAGPDQSTLLTQSSTLHGTVTDDGTPTDTPLQLAWTKVSGPGIVRFSNPNSLETDAFASLPGAYVLQLIATDTIESASDSLELLVYPSTLDQPPIVDAGPDLTVGQSTSCPLRGSVEDDDYQATGQLVSLWSRIDGPGDITFDNPSALVTTAHFSAPGTYHLRLTATDHASTSADELTVTLHPDNLPPTVDLGPDLTIARSDVDADWIRANRPAGGRIVVNHDEWTFSETGFQNAPGAAQFALNVAAWFTHNRPGRFLAWSSSFGLTGPSLAQILRAAGHEWTITVSLPFTLENLLAYDAVWLTGNPVDRQVLTDYVRAGGCVYLAAGTGAPFPDTEEAYWTGFLHEFGLALGPSFNGVIATLTVDGPHAILDGVDSLYFRNGNSVTDLLPEDPSTTIVLSALNHGLIGLVDPHSAPLELNAAVLDDGRPLGSTLTFDWELVSGPAPLLFTTPHAAATTALFDTPGTYVVRLSVTDSEFTAHDDLILTVTDNQPPTVDAGPDQSLTLPNPALLQGSVIPNASSPVQAPRVTWSLVTGPGTVTFSDSHSLGTSVTVSQPGHYLLQLQADDSEFIDTDLLTLTAYRPAQPIAPGLSAWWSFDQSLLDHSGQHSATPSGTITFEPGLNGHAARFNGFTSLLHIPAHPDLDPARTQRGLTLEAWIQPDDLARNSPIIAWSRPDGFTGLELRLGTFMAGTLSAWLTDPQGAVHQLITPGNFHPSDPRLVAIGRFQHIAFTYDQSSGLATIHLDGRLLAQTQFPSFTPRTDLDLWFGNRPGPHGFYRGLLDEVALHSRPLTTAELLEIVQAGPNNRPKSLAVNTGPDRATELSLTIHLEASVVGGSLPQSSTPLFFWSQINGPGSASFSSPNAPATTATFNHAGTYLLRLTAQDSTGTAYDELLVTVHPDGTLNQPPLVDAGPDSTAILGYPFPLLGLVTDDGLPTGQTLHTAWITVTSPAPVHLNDPNSPQPVARFIVPGTYVLQLTADDSVHTNQDTTTITVLENHPPVVHAGELISTSVDQVTLSGSVSDDSLPSPALDTEWSFIRGPAQPSIADPASLATSVSLPLPGAYLFRLIARDSQLSTSDDVVVTFLAPLNQPPVVDAGPDLVTTWSSPAQLQTSVTDDAQPFGTLHSAWSHVDGPAAATFIVVNGTTFASFPQPGSYTLRLTASDGDLTSTDDLSVIAVDVSPAPLVSLSLPDDAAIITAPITVIGTVVSDHLQGWRLEIRHAHTSTPPVIEPNPDPLLLLNHGTTPITDAPLGTFDPTTLPNGAYELRLSATDLLGRTTTTEPILVIVDGHLKPGRLTLSFTDLTVPLAGIPISIIRTYDSLRAQSGLPADFGAGWSLELRTLKLQKPRTLGRDWQSLSSGAWYALDPALARPVTITLPNDRVLHFTPVLTPNLQFGYPIASARMSFTNLPGTLGTLEIDGDNQADVDGYIGAVNLIDFSGFGFFNPQRFKLTTHEGFVYVIDELDGVQSITDPNGNSLVISPDGLTHSSGWSVPFNRDTHGRITSITDPAGRTLHYAYDARGDLVTFINPELDQHQFTYDDRHLLKSITDARGITVATLDYDTSGQLARQTDALGQPIAQSHDLVNRRELITDRLGNLTVHEYDDRGNVTRTIDPLGGITSFTYDDRDNILQTIDPLGRAQSFTYDDFDNLLTAVDPLGNTTRFTYDDHRQVTSVTDPKGNATTHTYDSLGNLADTRDALGNLTSFAYDSRGLLTAVTNAAGHVTRSTHDPQGRLVERTDPLGHTLQSVPDPAGNILAQISTRTTPTGLESIVTSFQYDHLNRVTNTTLADNTSHSITYNPIGQPDTTTDPLGRRSSFHYDPLGRLTRTVHPDGSTDFTAYDAEGRPIATTNQLGQITRFTHDPLGRLITIQHPDGTLESQFHDPAGQLVAITNPRGHSTWFGYDAAGRQTSLTNALGQVARFHYDPNGNLIESIDPAGLSTRFHYDALNRLISTTLADGTTTSTAYDSLGRKISSTDQEGNITRYGYDALGQLTSTTNALGHVTRYLYDELGRLIDHTDANNHTTTHQHDALGRRTSRSLPTGEREFFTYDPAGRMIAHTDFNGDQTTFQYDTADRLTARIPDPRRSEPPALYTYNNLGLRIRLDDPSGTTTYAYDSRNRLIAKTLAILATGSATPSTTQINYTRDANANVTSVKSSNPNGADAVLQYDALDRLITVHDVRLGPTHYAYDNAGRLTTTTLPNGLQTLNLYDTLHRLTNLLATTTAGPVANYAYSLSPTGRRLTAVEPLFTPTGQRSSTRAYSYDATHRLTAETISSPEFPQASLQYACDPAGNRLTRSSTLDPLPPTTGAYDPSDRLLTHTYDPNGNTLSAPNAFGESLSCQYNSANRLIRATTANGTTIDLVYNADGQRVARTVTTPTGQRSTTLFLIDTLNPTGHPQILEEFTATGSTPVQPSITRVHTWGHELLAQDQLLQDTWTDTYIGHDPHRNTRYLTDPTGQVTDHYDYDAHGNLISPTPDSRLPASAPAHLFSSEYFDTDLGLYYLRARYLNPNTGRFWTRDPFEGSLSHPPSLHPYLYADADPVNNWDPTGYRTLTEATVTLTIASIINSMTVYHGTDTLIRGQGELAQLGLAGPDLYDAIEVILAYQLVSDSFAAYNLARLGPALARFSSAQLASALQRLQSLTPKQWLHLKLWSPPPLARKAGQAEQAVQEFAIAGAAVPRVTAPDLMQQVRAADFSTPRGGAVFWTGYHQGNQAAAMRWADANNKFTIEMTSGGRWLNNLDLFGPNSPVSRTEANLIWRAASEEFASHASGHVNAFTRGTGQNPDSVFYSVELPALRRNPDVSRTITYRGY